MTREADHPGSADVDSNACLDCGYNRAGLEQNHRCPECGIAPDPGVVALWGSGMSDGVSPIRRSGWTIISLAVVVGLTIAREILEPAIGDALFYAVVLGGVAWWIYTWSQQGNRLPHSGGIVLIGQHQLRVSPQGFGIRRGYGPVDLQKWRPRWRVHVVESMTGKLVICVEQPIIGWLLLSRPLVFQPDAIRSDVNDAVEKMRRWIAESAKP